MSEAASCNVNTEGFGPTEDLGLMFSRDNMHLFLRHVVHYSGECEVPSQSFFLDQVQKLS